MEDGECAIWGTPAKVAYNEQVIYDSPRAGGKYAIRNNRKLVTTHWDNEYKAKLSTWIINQHLSGASVPLIDENLLNEDIDKKSSLGAIEKIEKFVIYCSKYKNKIGDKVFTGYEKFANMQGYVEGEDYLVMAYCEIESKNQAAAFLRMLHSIGYILDNFLTYKAFEKIHEIKTRIDISKQAFVAMWFDESVKALYDDAIEPAIRDAGFDPLRIDRKDHNNKIDDEIVAELRRSRFVVADFTSATTGEGIQRQAISRGGVYYEAGFAHGLGIPVIWTCRKDMINLVHFDTRQYNHIDWETPEDLKSKLFNRIRATIT